MAYKANKEYKLRLGSDVPEEITIHTKRQDAIDNINIAGAALHEIERKEEEKKLHRITQIPKAFASDMDHMRPQDGKVLLNELAKSLYLNAQDPEKYNIEFFARFFNIEPQTLKNMYNYIGYPIVEEETGQIVQILRFVDRRIK